MLGANLGLLLYGEVSVMDSVTSHPFGAVTRFIHPFGLILGTMLTICDIFGNLFMDTGASRKLYRHRLLSHLLKIVSAKDRIRRSIEVRHMLV